MSYIAILLSLVALLLQMQVSAWHRALVSIAQDNLLLQPTANRGLFNHELRFVTPGFVQSRSGIAGILLLGSSIAAGYWLGHWWIAMAWLVGLGLTANLLSRIALPASDAPYWGLQVLKESNVKMRACIRGGKVEMAQRYAYLIGTLRQRLELEDENSLVDAMEEFLEESASNRLRPDAGADDAR